MKSPLTKTPRWKVSLGFRPGAFHRGANVRGAFHLEPSICTYNMSRSLSALLDQKMMCATSLFFHWIRSINYLTGGYQGYLFAAGYRGKNREYNHIPDNITRNWTEFQRVRKTPHAVMRRGNVFFYPFSSFAFFPVFLFYFSLFCFALFISTSNFCHRVKEFEK